MLDIKKECTGCMACLNVCPVGAITEKIDENGFVMPSIDMDKCIHCGKCDKVCIINHDKSHFVEQPGIADYESIYPKEAYSMFHLDEEVVRKSSSGGAFYTLAKAVIENGGIVFGCFYDVKNKTAYLTDTDHIALEKLLTSKYVESYIGKGFCEVLKNLNMGRRVLFCASPCQCAGLRAYLGEEYDNLLLVDFTCGAVTSQKVLANYLESLEEKYKSEVVGLNFRDKKYGWGQYCMAIDFANGKKYRKTAMKDPYFFCFLRSSMQRLSCHGCRFANRHVSDIVLADFWKCNQFDVETNDKKGISLVLAMTQKGENAISDISDNVHMETLDLEKAAYNIVYRECPNEKLEEIKEDQSFAMKYGVNSLRKKLLSPKQRLYYSVRQYVMDRPWLSQRCKKLVGDGQIMKQSY
ncbi:MAG: Coenzyme F420 hydrogenase/dehydrogenase, beta subunit C-terminal domain [Lachnospiraceae bacterium]